MILFAAIKYGEMICYVPRPGRHHNIKHTISTMLKDSRKGLSDWAYENEIEGFVTNEGQFLDRRQAFIHATACHQITCRRTGPGDYNGDDLFSEDLWEGGVIYDYGKETTNE